MVMAAETAEHPGELLASAIGWHVEEDVNVGPTMRITVAAPAGITASEFGGLLAALERLWVACAGGDPESARLRIVGMGTGSFWAAIKAECKKNPIATFAAFLSILNASPAGPYPPVPPAPTPIVAKAQQNYERACDTIVAKGGTVHITIEVGSPDVPISVEDAQVNLGPKDPPKPKPKGGDFKL
jgi:hypothetical protein